jgi:tRNA(adenine34) deaminase
MQHESDGADEMDIDTDTYWMQQALAQAQRARALGEVPVGAVLVAGDACIAQGHNQPIREHDCSAHAEIVCLRAAGQALQNYRMPGTTLYVTLEPCVMCAGALIQARVERVVFGAVDPKAGAAGSVYDVLSLPRLNHAVGLSGGVLEAQCSDLLRGFFRERRQAAQQLRASGDKRLK